MISIAILLTGESGNKVINFQDYFNAQTIGIILLWLSADIVFLTLYTGYDYLKELIFIGH